MAAALVRAVRLQRETGLVSSATLSLARTAALLASAGTTEPSDGIAPESDADLEAEETGWGPARRVRFPVRIDGESPRWFPPARPLRSDPAHWS